jgi:glycosyltransferase involved in cell wall biosynthesis
MIKVLRIINRFNLGGPTYNVAYLSKYLPEEYETLLVGGVEDETEASSDFIVNNLGLKPVIIPEMRRSINPLNDYIAYKKLVEIIKSYKPDIVHTHASKAGTLGRLAAAACNVPVIVHTFHGHVFHSYFGKIQTTIFKNIERYLAKKSSAIIAISEKQKHELADIHKITSHDKITVVPLGFDLSKFQENTEAKRISFRKRYQLDDDEIAITIVGRLVPVKNHNLFLEGIKAVSEKTSKKIKAFIVGDGESRQAIEQKAKDLQIEYTTEVNTEKAILTFTSWIKEIDEVLAGSDIIALTSFNEGTPVSLIEAQAANKPIVTTDVGGIENVVLVNHTALMCKNNDIEGFSEQLLQLIENDELRKMLSVSGWAHVKEKYHYTRLTQDMANLYAHLLAKRHK